MGASLLAKAVDQSTSMLNVSPSSRAGSLPQGLAVFSGSGSAHHFSDVRLARTCAVRRRRTRRLDG
ncbi:hypothetical protein PkoCFBP13504_21560 [Pseudomonas koreensis]|nr:hypothetical protein PkoCFBP13504_21560 [Pseudomonas koreensis]